jgi:aspartate aminotransferase
LTVRLNSRPRSAPSSDNGLDFTQNEIAVAAGAKRVLFNAMMATLEPGDEIIIPTPFWVTYAEIVLIAGGKPVLVPCPEANGLRLSAEDLELAITSRTRWLMLNSLSNRFVTPAAIEPKLRDRTMTVNGVSKASAMTGWRIGYGAGPNAPIRAMAVVQSQSTSCPSSVSQAAAVAALNGPQDMLIERRHAFQRRRDLVVDALDAIDGVASRRPEGAFYVYASRTGPIGRRTPDGAFIDSDSTFCRFLLEEHNVAVVPRSCFGLAPFFRLSYAASEQELSEAVRRIANTCRELS